MFRYTYVKQSVAVIKERLNRSILPERMKLDEREGCYSVCCYFLFLLYSPDKHVFWQLHNSNNNNDNNIGQDFKRTFRNETRTRMRRYLLHTCPCVLYEFSSTNRSLSSGTDGRPRKLLPWQKVVNKKNYGRNVSFPTGCSMQLNAVSWKSAPLKNRQTTSNEWIPSVEITDALRRKQKQKE